MVSAIVRATRPFLRDKVGRDWATTKASDERIALGERTAGIAENAGVKATAPPAVANASAIPISLAMRFAFCKKEKIQISDTNYSVWEARKFLCFSL